MFQMMNEARLGVGLQGFALGNLAYLYALKYAKERVQGVDIRKMKDPNAPRVTIINHPDVRRMLITMKAYAEGIRALIYKTAYYADLAKVATDPKEKEICENTIDLLIPVVKAYSTDMSFRLTEWAIQIHGGYGYCGEYPVEQLCRDVKITSIYEGTNGIQAMDLVGRKLGTKKGALVMGWMKEMNEFIEKHKGHPTLGSFVTQLEQAKNSLDSTAMYFAKAGATGDPLYPMLQCVPFLEMFGEVQLAYLLVWNAFGLVFCGATLRSPGVARHPIPYYVLRMSWPSRRGRHAVPFRALARLTAILTLAALVAGGYLGVAAPPSNPEFLPDKRIATGLNCGSCCGEAAPSDVWLARCLSCHISYGELAKKTASERHNPHDSHYPKLDYTICHHGHQGLENLCISCHGQD